GANLVKKTDLTIDSHSAAGRAFTFYHQGPATIIDGGALFIHVLTLLPSGVVHDRVENEKCAAGSGKFLEMVASSLEIPLSGISDFAKSADNPYKISDSCAVFAESEVISRLNGGEDPANILAGIIRSIAEKAHTMFSRTNAPQPVFLVGGLTKIPFFVQSLQQSLGLPVMQLPMDPQLAGAFGAALFAQDLENGHGNVRTH
ncbi:hypothetical protein KJ865_05425, partial [Myxococcota bacterium]|nr:hypothetical protein [Myxococcota bacterium]